jgi:antitoxin HigA-1
MTKMYNPAHPGKVIKGIVLEDRNITLADFAKKIKVSRVTLSKIVNGHSGVTPDVAIRLGLVLGTGPEFWLKMQNNYDIYQAQKKWDKKKIKLEPLKTV